MQYDVNKEVGGPPREGPMVILINSHHIFKWLHYSIVERLGHLQNPRNKLNSVRGGRRTTGVVSLLKSLFPTTQTAKK